MRRRRPLGRDRASSVRRKRRRRSRGVVMEHQRWHRCRCRASRCRWRSSLHCIDDRLRDTHTHTYAHAHTPYRTRSAYAHTSTEPGTRHKGPQAPRIKFATTRMITMIETTSNTNNTSVSECCLVFGASTLSRPCPNPSASRPKACLESASKILEVEGIEGRDGLREALRIPLDHEPQRGGLGSARKRCRVSSCEHRQLALHRVHSRSQLRQRRSMEEEGERRWSAVHEGERARQQQRARDGKEAAVVGCCCCWWLWRTGGDAEEHEPTTPLRFLLVAKRQSGKAAKRQSGKVYPG